MRDSPQSELEAGFPLIALRSLVVCVALWAVIVPAGVAAAAFPGANGRIAYAEWEARDTLWTTFTFRSRRPNGTGQRLVVRHAESLNYSADGHRIVFARAGGIGVARADGRDRSWLLGHAPRESDPPSEPSWAALSPDGTQVAFHDGGNAYAIGVDGADLRLIANDAREPVFSPDGTRIAYVKSIFPKEAELHALAIETIAVDGTDSRRLIYYPEYRGDGYTYPIRLDFAPDGRRLAVVEYFRKSRIQRLAIVDAQTGARRRIPARVTGSVVDAVWSPDGRRIAFVAQAHSPGPTPVFTIRPSGTGKRIAFTTRTSTGIYGIYGLAWQPRP